MHQVTGAVGGEGIPHRGIAGNATRGFDRRVGRLRRNVRDTTVALLRAVLACSAWSGLGGGAGRSTAGRKSARAVRASRQPPRSHAGRRHRFATSSGPVAWVAVCSLFHPALVSGGDFGQWCDPEWIRTATAEDAKAELKKTDPVSSRSKHGMTALHCAAQFNPDPSVTELLVDAGIDINTAHDISGSTPLHLAAGGYGTSFQMWFQVSLAWRVRDRNRVPSLADMEMYERALEEELGVALNRPAVVEVLLDRGADIEVRDLPGETPLSRAAAGNRDIAVMKLLVERGAEVNSRARKGWAPVHGAAAFNSNPAVLEFLLHHGADPALPNQPATRCCTWRRIIGTRKLRRWCWRGGGRRRAKP